MAYQATLKRAFTFFSASPVYLDVIADALMDRNTAPPPHSVAIACAEKIENLKSTKKDLLEVTTSSQHLLCIPLMFRTG